MNKLQTNTNNGLHRIKSIDLRQTKLLNKLNSSLQAIQDAVNNHHDRLDKHGESISKLGLENNKQNNDLNILRHRSEKLNRQLNNSIYERMKENIQHKQSAQRLNDSVNELKAENDHQNQFAKNFSKLMRRLEDQQNVSNTQVVRKNLEENRIAMILNNSILLLQSTLNTSIQSMKLKYPEQESKLRKINREMRGLVKGKFELFV